MWGGYYDKINEIHILNLRRNCHKLRKNSLNHYKIAFFAIFSF